MTLGIRALTTSSEYRLSAPQPKDLWSARNPAEWKRIYLSQQHNLEPRVMDLLASLPTISVMQGFLDRALAMKLMFHLIGGLITEYHQMHGDGISHESTQSRKRELETAIRNFDHAFSRDICASYIGSFIVSYLSMTLKVSVGNIEVLVGKAGERESREMYRIMKDWPETSEAREAIWHAGQILRLFKLLYRLTSFQIIMAYHAGLVLFAYSVLSCVRGHFPTTQNASELCLNDMQSAHAEEFIRNWSTEPMLRSDFRGTERNVTSLLATKEAVEIMSEIILNKACNCEELSPRLVNGLVKLLKDLASAIQIIGGYPFPPGIQFDRF
ncbi:hypothetical protein GQ43DRAFT_109233 [Delitschia confertaspora ATCC 74209]|uniref:Transcription factor domain-containing protein n=1 Tax=Delitschia confertaspora ATCC 74209 TaxID=1513339 RepID=A0A9P4JUX4_9PLEO|nr:hypothetical protein GQ43DRAFT_109233 [Delitschia confertaspora ATCC 74209]